MKNGKQSSTTFDGELMQFDQSFFKTFHQTVIVDKVLLPAVIINFH